MRGGSDDRAVAVQVGAIILFAFVIIAIAGYQASVVPDQNEQIEFNHNQEVQGQLQDLQGAIQSTPTAGGSRTVVVESSTSYPARTIFVNPPRVTGRLRTVGTGNPAVAIEVRNATAVGETSDFWDGTTRNYSTGAFAFDPNYNVYSEAPRTFVSYSLVYNEFTSDTVVVNAQSIFDGRRISLVALNGSYDEQGGAASVTVRPVSASSTRVSVEPESSSDPLSVAIVSRLDASQWETVLTEAGEYDENNNMAGAYVTAVRKTGNVTVPGGQTLNRIEFELEGGTTYSLSLAKAGVGTNVNATPSDRYVTTVSLKNVSTTAGAKETLTVEVRDEFNNPLAGVPLNATVEKGQGSIVEADETETGDDGRVGFTYQAPDASTDARVNVSISKAGGQTAAVTFNVSVSKANGGGGGGNGAYNVTLTNVSDTNSPASAVNCQNWPSNRTCVVDGSQLSAVNVTMGTSPTAVGAGVSWAVNNTTVATVDPAAGETQGNGENSTDVTLNQNGDVVVYASSGAGGNRTTLRVTGLGGGSGADTTPPTLDDITVSTTAGTNNGQLESIEWDYTASDARANFSNVTLVAADDKGDELWNVTSSQASAVLSNSSGWNYKKRIDLTVTLRDSAGNQRTCTASIASPGQNAALGDFTCSPTQSIRLADQGRRPLQVDRSVRQPKGATSDEAMWNGMFHARSRTAVVTVWSAPMTIGEVV